jgi:hypothetical protein
VMGIVRSTPFQQRKAAEEQVSSLRSQVSGLTGTMNLRLEP